MHESVLRGRVIIKAFVHPKIRNINDSIYVYNNKISVFINLLK